MFQRWRHPYPCGSEGNSSSGLLFVKVPKTAGTTVAGVARRIVAKRSDELRMKCNYKGGHGSPRTTFGFDGRDLKKSFLLTFIRKPEKRALSSFFYHEVSKHGLEPSDANFLKVSSIFFLLFFRSLTTMQASNMKFLVFSAVGEGIGHRLSIQLSTPKGL